MIPATGAAFARIREPEDGKAQGRRSRDQSHAQRLAASMARTHPLRLFGFRLSLVKESGGAGINSPANGEQEHSFSFEISPQRRDFKASGAIDREAEPPQAARFFFGRAKGAALARRKGSSPLAPDCRTIFPLDLAAASLWLGPIPRGTK